MRGLVGVLRDPAAGPDPPQPTLADLPALVAGLRDTGVDVERVETGAPFPIGAATELAGYQLAQAGLTNPVRHAGAGARVAVVVAWQPSDLAVEVIDDGGAVTGPPRVPGTGAGLPGLRDRVASAGGTFSAGAGMALSCAVIALFCLCGAAVALAAARRILSRALCVGCSPAWCGSARSC